MCEPVGQLLILIITFIMALMALVKMRRLNERLDKMDRAFELLRQRPYSPAPTAPPTLPAEPKPTPAPIAPPPTAETVPLIEDSKPVSFFKVMEEMQAAEAPKERLSALVDDWKSKPSPVAAQPKPKDSATLEERLGARLTVWIGAIALALAGAYLVKYSFDKNLLTPAIRVGIGIAFGIGMLGAGEWFRKRTDRIGQGLTAAGIAVLFANLLAATNLYHLFSPLTGFLLMALTAGLAIALSLRQGPFVALLGLLGGFLTPAVIQAGEAQPSLLLYLLVLQIALMAVTRSRGWSLLAGLTLIGSVAWAALWLLTMYKPEHSVWLGAFLLGSVLITVLAATAGSNEKSWDDPSARLALIWAGAGAGLILMALLVGVGNFSWIEWGFFAILGAGCVVLARLDPKTEGLAWFASASGAALLIAWTIKSPAFPQERFALTTLFFGTMYAGGAYACLWRSRQPARWASLSVLSAVTYFLVGYFLLKHPPTHLSWGGICLILAVAYAIASLPVHRKRSAQPSFDLVLAALLVGVTAFISLAIPIELRREWLAVAWALQIPALAWLERKLRVPQLRIVAGALAVIVAARLLANPNIANYPVGEYPIWNWLLYGYGIPIVAFAAAASIFGKTKKDRFVDALEQAAIAFGFVLLTLQIRHFFHRGQIAHPKFTFNELATFSVIWLVYSAGLLAAAMKWPKPTLLNGGKIVLGVALIGVALGQFAFANPLLGQQPIGQTPILNWLLYAYGLPAVLLAMITWVLWRLKQSEFALASGISSLVLAFALITLQVRHFFHGEEMAIRTGLKFIETGTLSVAWLLFSYLLLIADRRLKSPLLVQASVTVLGIAGVYTLVMHGLLMNPAWAHHDVGATPIVNWLMFVYGLPAVLLLVMGRELWRRGEIQIARATNVVALIQFFLLVSLQVRQYFRGPFLDAGTMNSAEMYTYSAAWIVFGILLLTIGVVTRSVISRYASLAVMLIAVTKVFLWDTAHLRDLYRVFSFLCLGGSLMLLAYVYQKFVFTKKSQPADDNPNPSRQ